MKIFLYTTNLQVFAECESLKFLSIRTHWTTVCSLQSTAKAMEKYESSLFSIYEDWFFYQNEANVIDFIQIA